MLPPAKGEKANGIKKMQYNANTIDKKTRMVIGLIYLLLNMLVFC